MPRWARTLRRFSTTDGMGLLIVGVASIARGVSYAPPVMPDGQLSSHVAETWLPMDAWSVVWMLAGALCIGAAFHWRSRLAALSVGLTVGLHTLFGASFLWGSLHGNMSRGWVSAISYFAVALLVLWAVGRGRREDGEVTPRGDPA